MPPRLSIVIPSYNRPDLLRACLASVQQHAPVGTEVIVVDDGSPDAVIGRTAVDFAGVRVIPLARRSGFCVAANAGLRAAQGEIVELLNDDTEVAADWAGPALALFADPGVAAVAPLVLDRRAKEPHIDSAGDRYYLGGIAAKRGHGEPLTPEYLRPCRVFGASGSSAFYRRDVVIHVGAFPERFGAYFEDVDLAFRLHRAGYTVRFEPASRVFHHGAASHGQGRKLIEQQSRNEERVFWRNVPASSLRRAIPHHLAVLTAKAWRRWTEGNLLPFVCGRLRVLGDARELLRHRRTLKERWPSGDLDGWEVDESYWGRVSTAEKVRGRKPRPSANGT
ncbi:MAG: glycosyltransferase family 2 protein [Gemmataceae bacterium]|nr:glycosyltransferase family 2 protein [Gemmataceae bacterium]